MEKNFSLSFDKKMVKQLRKAIRNKEVMDILKGLLDDLEEFGLKNAKLLDNTLWLYELKYHRPPIRLYVIPVVGTTEIYVLEFEMKTNEKKQKMTLDRLRVYVRWLKSQIFSRVFLLFDVFFEFYKSFS